ncbi:MFS transporter [Naumannella cuiyingiana]|uniref:AAHS family benzoate transporter-like MFS transporter n=1 Tax=Naumannella cuiyingiana TaxID=1347891 RepID=A0A7Z0DA53_9ACTN|nr:aromatic acid/H+ symport family MFS transporter [Naumannella cuiyingiana]NYI71785.1 AAHS family benzoate transporter-like MFS transporter [Naumannella cuiyingiana]
MTVPTPTDQSRERVHPLRWLTVALCAFAIVFDGYDLVVYGTTVGALREEWGISAGLAGLIGSLSLVGMLIGALAVGTLTDLWGRRRTMIACVVLFSVAMPLCALATGPEAFGALRFIAGLGLGGVMPIASALVTEYAPAQHRNVTYVTMQSGYAVGGMLAAGLAIAIVPTLGWRAMYLIGGLPILIFLPLALAKLPESLDFLVSHDRREAAARLAARLGMEVPEPTPSAERRGAVGTLFSRGYLAPTLLFWAMSFCALLTIYGFSTWLPDIMRRQGFALGSALSLLLTFNLGSIIGSVLGGVAADRRGSRPVIAVGFAAGAIAAMALSAGPEMIILYLLCALGGFGTIGVQNLINPYVTRFYPPHARATGVGWALGIGRLGAICGPILGGLLLDTGLGPQWSFYLFAVASATGLLATLALYATRPRRAAPTPTDDTPLATTEGPRP